jgi:hypothetical protein
MGKFQRNNFAQFGTGIAQFLRACSIIWMLLAHMMRGGNFWKRE